VERCTTGSGTLEAGGWGSCSSWSTGLWCLVAGWAAAARARSRIGREVSWWTAALESTDRVVGDRHRRRSGGCGGLGGGAGEPDLWDGESPGSEGGDAPRIRMERDTEHPFEQPEIVRQAKREGRSRQVRVFAIRESGPEHATTQEE
jgi:hypothetical protein